MNICWRIEYTNRPYVEKKRMEDNMAKADREEWAKKVDLITATFLEGFLEKVIIRLNDGLLDAPRKIENAA